MTIGRLAHALAILAAAATLVPTLRADAGPSRERQVVLYLGHHLAAEEDPGYRYFSGQFAKLRPTVHAATQLIYVPLTPDELAYLTATGDDTRWGANLTREMSRRPALIVASGAGAMQAAQRIARATPTVFSVFMDPVRSGFVDDIQRRSSPVTGIDLSDNLDGKRFEILHEAYPNVRSVAVLVDSQWTSDDRVAPRITAEARRSGLDATLMRIDTKADLVAMFDRPEAAAYDAWYIPLTYIAQRSIDTIIPTMRRLGKPCIYADRYDVDDGGLMSYTQDTSFSWDALVDLTARVLEGEPPGSIPIVRPQRFELSVRLKSDTGVPPPSSAVIRRADHVVR
jgi:putative ABC transport system substrate-binding protein